MGQPPDPLKGLNVPAPIRVLHLIDSLGGGGSERWIYDIVRLANPQQIEQRVFTVFPDLGEFPYAPKLRELGAYREPLQTCSSPSPAGRELESSTNRLADLQLQAGKLLRSLIVSETAPLAFLQPILGSRFSRIARRLCRRLPKAFAEHQQFRPHVLHAHTFEGFLYGLCLKLTLRRPLVHLVPCRFSQMRDAGYDWMPPLYRECHRWVDHFFHAEGYEDELLAIGIPARKLSPIRGVLDLSVCRATSLRRTEYRTEIRGRLNVPQDAILGLSVGRLHPSKGHHCTIRALPKILQRFPNLHWVLLGTGPELPRLQTLVRELGVEQNAHLVGFIDDPLPYYAASDLFFRTYLMEGENLSSYLAMSQGLPVVGFQTGCPNDLIGIVGHGWHVRVGDRDDFAKRVCDVLALSDQGQSVGARGFAYSAAELDIQASITSFESAYRILAAGPGLCAEIVNSATRRRQSPDK